jgi:hypothetical protein
MNWSSKKEHHPPSEHELHVFVDDVEVTHVFNCITGEDIAGISGICVVGVLNEEGNFIPALSGSVLRKVLYGKVEVREIK